MTFPTMNSVAELLESARQGQGLSLAELGRQTGISSRQVKAKLAGDSPITTGDLAKFATALSTTPTQIYTELG